MTYSEYTRLKQQIVLNAGNSDNHTHLLKTLKDYYADDIDSLRRYEKIDTLGKLLKVLEIRDVLSEDNVLPLKEISRKLSDDHLLTLINDYENRHTPREYINYYGVPEQNDKENIDTTQSNCKHPFESLSPKKSKRINDTLVEEIGTFWRDLARNLRIRECKIDEIDTKYTKLSDKARQLMLLYEEKCDPQKWFFVLCEALEKSRRKDLKRSLEEIMTMNI